MSASSAEAPATPLKAAQPASSASSSHLQVTPAAATPSAAAGSASGSAQHSPAYHAMLSSPLSSTHSKFPLPGDPGYVKPHVFLGGSCDPTTWRSDIAIPQFVKRGIPFFNPQRSDWHPNLIALEAKAKEVCEVLLFVIDSNTRAIASMLEAVELIMSQRRVVVVILDIPDGAKIDGETIGGRQLKDLNRARAFLCDIAARHQRYCDVFDSVENAVNHIVMTYRPQ